jgi:hypothetical protein
MVYLCCVNVNISLSEICPVETRLHHELLHIRGYSKLIRPTANNSVQLIVKIGLRLSQLLDMVSSFLLSIKLSLYNLTIYSMYLLTKLSKLIAQ